MTNNKNFQRVQEQIQSTLPYLGVWIILCVYLVTALSMGHFLHARMSTAGFLAYVIAYGTGFGSQFTRAYIVFNSQLGYGNPYGGYHFSVVFALLLTVYTSYEAFHLAPDTFVSTLGIVGSGFIVEFLYLRELNRASRYQLLKDTTLLAEFVEFEKRERELKDFLSGRNDHFEGLKNNVQFDYEEPEQITFDYPLSGNGNGNNKH